MTKVSAPFQAYFKPTATRAVEPDMVAHSLADMMVNVARIVAIGDSRYKGYIKVLNSNGLRVAEINVLGAIELSREDMRAIREEAASRRDEPSLTRRMIQHDASERAERGEPYNERDGG
jgi:hypothetical protein